MRQRPVVPDVGEVNDKLPILAPTATHFEPDAAGAVVVCGSHGGMYPGVLVSRAGIRAVIFNDAGVGLEEAGIASLALLDRYGVAAATASHLSCRIGDANDMVARGVISHANSQAAMLGLKPGVTVVAAARLLEAARPPTGIAPEVSETRHVEQLSETLRLVLVDSASHVEESDSGAIVVTGSHGGLVDGDPRRALRANAKLAVFNDGGIGVDQCGIARLPVLDARAVAAVTVSCFSARIGDARSALETGRISALNERARLMGIREGDALSAIVAGYKTA